MMRRTTAVLILGIVAVTIVVFAVAHERPTDDAHAEAAVRAVVAEFGTRLAEVSVLAPADVRAAALEEAVGPYVTRELLEVWVDDPESAPGRRTSSPWPEDIHLTLVMRTGDLYHLRGEIVYVANDEAGVTEAYRTPVTLTLVEERGEWRIALYREGEQPAPATTTRPDTVSS